MGLETYQSIAMQITDAKYLYELEWPEQMIKDAAGLMAFPPLLDHKQAKVLRELLGEKRVLLKEEERKAEELASKSKPKQRTLF